MGYNLCVRAMLLTFAALASAAASGCGGDGPSDPRQSFAGRANAICRHTADELRAARAAQGRVSRVTAAELFNATLDRGYLQVSKLTPPDDERATWSRFVETWGGLAAGNHRAVAAYRRGSAARAKRIIDALGAPGGAGWELDRLARELRLGDCAREL